MKIKTQLVLSGVALFLITILLDFMFNLLSADSEVVAWYNENSLWFFIIAGILVLLGVILTIISIKKKDRSKVEIGESTSSGAIQADEDDKYLREQLARHQENRQKLLRQKSVYVAGEEPLHLLTQIAAEEKEIKDIEEQLRRLEA